MKVDLRKTIFSDAVMNYDEWAIFQDYFAAVYSTYPGMWAIFFDHVPSTTDLLSVVFTNLTLEEMMPS
jgi:hypothetical protein